MVNKPTEADVNRAARAERFSSIAKQFKNKYVLTLLGLVVAIPVFNLMLDKQDADRLLHPKHTFTSVEPETGYRADIEVTPSKNLAVMRTYNGNHKNAYRNIFGKHADFSTQTYCDFESKIEGFTAYSIRGTSYIKNETFNLHSCKKFSELTKPYDVATLRLFKTYMNLAAQR